MLRNLTFADLEVGMRIFDLEDEEFGEIQDIQADDPEWRMLEVKWENEDPKVDDRSYVLSGKHVAVVVGPDMPMREKIEEAMGDELEKIRAQHGNDFQILNLVDVW